MGEIKSTLDLVMEKTKNLNLSDAEKQDQKNKEIGSRLGGLLQKFEDQIITREQFKSKYQVMREEYNLTGNQHEHLIKAVCARINLGSKNQALMDLLSQFADSNIEGIASVLQEFDTALQSAAAEQTQIARERLAGKHFITGSAVVPNLQTDPAWRKKVQAMQVSFGDLLNQAIAKLLAA